MPERFNPLETKYPIWNVGWGRPCRPRTSSECERIWGFRGSGYCGLASESVGQLIKETRQLTSSPLGPISFYRCRTVKTSLSALMKEWKF